MVYGDPALRQTLTGLGSAFQHTHPGNPRIFAAPPAQMLGLLAHGTQADMLVTTTAFMDRAVQSGLVADARRTLWRNRLVIAGREGLAAQPFSPAALDGVLAGGVLAAPDDTDASDVDGVAIMSRLAPGVHLQGTANTSDALDMVRAGTARLALCHQTELANDPSLARIMAVPDDAYTPIIYQAALTRTAWSRNQMALLDFLAGDAAPRARELGLEVMA